MAPREVSPLEDGDTHTLPNGLEPAASLVPHPHPQILPLAWTLDVGHHPGQRRIGLSVLLSPGPRRARALQGDGVKAGGFITEIWVRVRVRTRAFMGCWYVPGTITGTEERAVEKTGRGSCPQKPGVLEEETQKLLGGHQRVLGGCGGRARAGQGPLREQGQAQASPCACELECAPLGYPWLSWGLGSLLSAGPEPAYTSAGGHVAATPGLLPGCGALTLEVTAYRSFRTPAQVPSRWGTQPQPTMDGESRLPSPTPAALPPMSQEAPPSPHLCRRPRSGTLQGAADSSYPTQSIWEWARLSWKSGERREAAQTPLAPPPSQGLVSQLQVEGLGCLCAPPSASASSFSPLRLLHLPSLLCHLRVF